MRSLVPADSLVYLETNDLAAALQPIVDNPAFDQVAKSKPDFSALEGVQLAIAVTGFETSEEKLTDEQSIGRIQPRFVAVADTHAWNYQAVGFAEKKLGTFVENIYDSEPTLDKSDKSGGKYFTWTAKDGRKAYALVIDAVIYFGNDESAIDKCLAVRRGDADNIAKNPRIPPSDGETVASGYVGPDGIAQIANIIGLKFASEASEDSDVQRAITGILPQVLRNSVTEIRWTAVGSLDKYVVSMPPDITNVLNETVPAKGAVEILHPDLLFVPEGAESVTIYNLDNAKVAWRSLLFTAQKHVDPIGQTMISEFSGALLEPYGIKDPEGFLDSISGPLTTVKFRGSDEDRVLIALVKQNQKLLTIEPTQRTTDPSGIEILLTEDGDQAAALLENRIVIGHRESVSKCLEEHRAPSPKTMFSVSFPDHFANGTATATTVGKDYELVGELAEVLSMTQSVDSNGFSGYSTETRFTKTGIERRTVSPFGLIGSIIAQLGQD